MLGTVTVLRRYPVKSMLGEELDAAEVSRSGLARDRRLAVVSRRTGKVASAKYPRLWRDMLTLSAEALDDAARITLPDGKTVSSTDPGVDEVLSAVLGQPVTLTDTPPPGAALDRAVPEAVLREGIKAQAAARSRSGAVRRRLRRSAASGPDPGRRSGPPGLVTQVANTGR